MLKRAKEVLKNFGQNSSHRFKRNRPQLEFYKDDGVFDIVEKFNSYSHNEQEKHLVKALENTLDKYHSLQLSLIEKNGPKDHKIVTCVSYVMAIVNNARTIKRLFEMGMHLQMEIIMRSQFEYLNLVYCIMKRDSFFEKMFVKNGSDWVPIKPTANFAKKEMLKTDSSKDVKKGFQTYFVLLNEIFSKAAHGHPYHVFEASIPVDSDLDSELDWLDVPIGGNKIPSENTKSILIDMNNYTQILFLSIADFFVKHEMVHDSKIKELADVTNLHLLGEEENVMTVKKVEENKPEKTKNSDSEYDEKQKP